MVIFWGYCLILNGKKLIPQGRKHEGPSYEHKLYNSLEIDHALAMHLHQLRLYCYLDMDYA